MLDLRDDPGGLLNVAVAVSAAFLPADVLVASRRTFEKWAAIPGTIYHTARTEGRVLYGEY